MLTKHLYVRIRRDRIDVRCPETGRAAARTSERGFSTRRLLIGDADEAGALLQSAVGECIVASEFVPARRVFVMHPLDFTEGGLSPVELRVLSELSSGAGAAHMVVHEGRELDDDGVLGVAGNAD